jgi:D-inositol-3-phosphate glycosyltransferase
MLEAEVDRRGLRDRVHFVEPQPHELLSSYYRAADVCLVPSRSESFGLVALESAACGTPVVAAAVGGLTTLVDHGRTGFLVDDDEPPSAFAEAARRVLEDSLLAEQMSTAAVVRARRYTWARSAAVLRATYEELAVGNLVECR